MTTGPGTSHPVTAADPVTAGGRGSRIAAVEVTPVAFADPPLLNVVGVHQPWALRAIVQVRTDDGLLGLGETYGDEAQLARLQAVADRLGGHDPFDLHGLRVLVADVLAQERSGAAAGASFGGMLDVDSALETVFSPFEVACLDIQARWAGVPVSALLGGAVRERVQFSGYLFYRWAGHPGEPADGWGEALGPDQLVDQSRRMVDGWGFGSLKLKGGVLPPEQECVAIEALADAFPGMPLRLDPNGAWTPTTSVRVAERLAGVVEYLEDPTPGIAGMAEVSAQVDVPLATNMCVIAMEHLPPAIAADAVQVVLSDHHLWGGLRRSALLGGITQTWGARAVDAQQLPPRDLARRHGAPGRGDAQPHLRLRHPLPVEDPGRHPARGARLRRRRGGGADDARARRRARRRPARRAARAVPAVRGASARGHGLHALDRPHLHPQHLPLVTPTPRPQLPRQLDPPTVQAKRLR